MRDISAQVKSTSKVLRCKLTSSVTQGCALAAGFAVMIDYQTLVTHNHTIICGSLDEGLTYSPCAQGAQTDCHKKDCAHWEYYSEIMPTHSFTFLFTVSCQSMIGDFWVFCSPLYIGKKISVRVAIELKILITKINLSPRINQNGQWQNGSFLTQLINAVCSG